LSKTIEAGCTEGEAMSALAKAQAMIDIYDVTDEELALTKEEKATARIYENRDPNGVKRGLAYAVHKFTGTTGWTQQQDEKRATCGLPADIEFAEWLLDALDGFVKREYVRFAIKSAVGDGNERRAAMHSFVNGCTQRISQRLIELAEPPKHQTTNARALVVTKQAAIDEYLQSEGIKLGRGRARYFNVQDSASFVRSAGYGRRRRSKNWRRKYRSRSDDRPAHNAVHQRQGHPSRRARGADQAATCARYRRRCRSDQRDGGAVH
jgi:hypothetical protein